MIRTALFDFDGKPADAEFLHRACMNEGLK
jgi:hypothetical protein